MDSVVKKGEKQYTYTLSSTQKKRKYEREKERKDSVKARLNEMAEVTKEKERLLLEKQALEKRVEQLELEGLDLRQQMAQLEQDNVVLRQQMAQLEKKMEQLEQTAVKIVDNTASLISQLPPNSPFRRPLLSFFLDGLAFSDAKKDLCNFKENF
jgi:chromosome segregation ATPase